MIKIYFPLNSFNVRYGVTKSIILPGLLSNENISIVNNDSDADYCINYFECTNPSKKLIILDYTDSPSNLIWDGPYLLYMKRSCVYKINGTSKFILPVLFGSIVPISYSLKESTEKYKGSSQEKNVDISCFFSYQKLKNKRFFDRWKVANFIQDLKKLKEFQNYNIHVGIIGYCGNKGRTTINKKYFQMLKKSKIVVTCNPSSWCGDYRLYESFAGNSMVFVDKMIMPVKNSFEHKKHLFYYDLNALEKLKNALLYYLKNNSEREYIANTGYNYVLEYHRPKNRINEMLEEIDDIKKK